MATRRAVILSSAVIAPSIGPAAAATVAHPPSAPAVRCSCTAPARRRWLQSRRRLAYAGGLSRVRCDQRAHEHTGAVKLDHVQATAGSSAAASRRSGANRQQPRRKQQEGRRDAGSPKAGRPSPGPRLPGHEAAQAPLPSRRPRRIPGANPVAGSPSASRGGVRLDGFRSSCCHSSRRLPADRLPPRPSVAGRVVGGSTGCAGRRVRPGQHLAIAGSAVRRAARDTAVRGPSATGRRAASAYRCHRAPLTPSPAPPASQAGPARCPAPRPSQTVARRGRAARGTRRSARPAPVPHVAIPRVPRQWPC